MRRVFLTVVLALALALPALAQSAPPQPIYFWPNTALTISAPGQPSLPRVIRPSQIGLFADGAWVVDHLHWSGWGSSVAHATGISSASNGIPSIAQGKRITNPARVTLSSPGRFQGHEVYRCFALSVPAKPSVDQHLCLQDFGGYWFFATPPPPPRALDFLDPLISGGCEMTRTLVMCETYGSTISQKATLTAKGVVKICTQSGFANTCNQGNFGLHTPTYKVGRTVTFGPFHCQVLKAGAKCTVISSGKGFLISKTKTVRIK